MSNINITPFYSRGYENAELELIKVETNEQGKKLVSGRELHEVLEIGRDFTTWIKKMIEYGFVENVDYIVFTQTGVNPKGGRPQIDYILTLEMAKHIAMLQRTEIGMKVRNYFIECEKVAQGQFQEPLKMTFEEIMIAQLQEQQRIKQQQALIEQQVKTVQQKVHEIEENAPLEPGEYSLVSRRVSSRVYEVKNERGWELTQKQMGELFRALNRDIQEITGIRIRTQLRKRHLDTVLNFINDWYPSKATMFNINQMSLDI